MRSTQYEVVSNEKVLLEDPTGILEKAEVEAELLPSAGARRAGLLKAGSGIGLEGGCWMVWMWPSELGKDDGQS